MKIDADIVGGIIMVLIVVAGFVKLQMWRDTNGFRKYQEKPCDWCGAEIGQKCPILCGRDPDND